MVLNSPECLSYSSKSYIRYNLVPVTRIAFWRNGQGFLYDGSINFGWDDGFYQDNTTGTQTLSGVFGNFSDGTIRRPRSMDR